MSPQRGANLARVPTEGLHRLANCEVLFLLSASKALLLSFALSPFGASGGICYYGGREVRSWLSVVIVCVDDGCLSCTFGTVFKKTSLPWDPFLQLNFGLVLVSLYGCCGSRRTREVTHNVGFQLRLRGR